MCTRGARTFFFRSTSRTALPAYATWAATSKNRRGISRLATFGCDFGAKQLSEVRLSARDSLSQVSSSDINWNRPKKAVTRI